MKRYLILILTLILGCKTEEYSKLMEHDDLYFTSQDRREAARQKPPEANVVDANQTPASTGKSDTYIKGEEKKQPASISGQSDTYIYNFDSKTFEKAGTSNSNQNTPSGSGGKRDSLGK
jgi:hypothetical protein